MTVAFLFVASLLLIGVVLRMNVRLFQWMFIPASVIAGMVGLVAVQVATNSVEGPAAETVESLCKILSGWPGWLIAVVFAGMLLLPKPPQSEHRVRNVVRQGVMVWVIVLGETAVGLLAVWLLVLPFFDVPNSFGMLIETGFAGGHGTAAAMGDVFAHDSIALQGGRDLGMLMATFGLVFGIVTGVLWINIGVRRGWVSTFDSAKCDTESGQDKVIGFAKVSSDTVDPLLLQVIWLSLAFGVGILAQSLVKELASSIDQWFVATEPMDEAQKQLSQRLTVSNVADFPLFIYTLFGGLLVRKTLETMGVAYWLDGQTIQRLTSAAMDILVVAAITSLNLSVVYALAIPFSILFCCGTLWTVVCLLLISRWILPRSHWFELGLINYGMSTGTTATGFVLLKMVDPQLKSGAAEEYALAAPLSAPFIGGGMITIAMPLLLLERVPIAIPALVTGAVVIGLIGVGIQMAKADKSNS